MPADCLSHFAEKAGIVYYECHWGRWWQTVHEIHVEVILPTGTRARELTVDVQPQHITLEIGDEQVFKGKLFSVVKSEETLWTIEDQKMLCLQIIKATPTYSEAMWTSLLEDGRFAPDPQTLHEMRKKLDLEKFQIENPGFDFSHAQLSKTYDKPPGNLPR